jgi:cell division protein FtsB
MNWLILAPILISAAMAGAAWIGNATGIVNVRLARRHNAQEAQSEGQKIQQELISKAMEIVDRQHTEMLSIEQRLTAENQQLRERIRFLETQVGELEKENTELKVEAFDRQKRQRRSGHVAPFGD